MNLAKKDNLAVFIYNIIIKCYINECLTVLGMKEQNLLVNTVSIVITLSAIILLTLHIFSPELQIDNIALSLIILALLPWLLPLLKHYLSSGKFFGQEFIFLQNTVNKQGEELKNQRNIIEFISEALKRNLTRYESYHLSVLASNKESSNYKYSEYLKNDMMRLCQYGYVEETFFGSTGKMAKKGNARFDLKEFYKITDEGKNYLQMLEELNSYLVCDDTKF